MNYNDNQLKDLVKEKYSSIARTETSCCGSGCCGSDSTAVMADDYSQLEGYNPDADLGLGCGLPTQFAQIKKGDVVIDLGSGAGNDAFIARHETGETGKVIGIDFTEAMIAKARSNSEKLGFHKVEFRQGDIESMPVNDNSADVIVSNCVLNLVPNKEGVFKEIFRVLKNGGHFSISDIVLEGELSPEILKSAEMYAGCVSGAILKEDYLGLIEKNGFTNITIQKEKEIVLPENTVVKSITVYAEKPSAEKKSCCGPECCN